MSSKNFLQKFPPKISSEFPKFPPAPTISSKAALPDCDFSSLGAQHQRIRIHKIDVVTKLFFQKALTSIAAKILMKEQAKKKFR